MIKGIKCLKCIYINYLLLFGVDLTKQKGNVRLFALIKTTKAEGKQTDPHDLKARISSTKSLFNIIGLTLIVDGFPDEKTNYQH